jgi:hypothetical protein
MLARLPLLLLGLAMASLLATPSAFAQDERMERYAELAERYEAASDEVDAGGAEATPQTLDGLITTATEFRAFLTDWLIDDEMAPDVATSVRDDRFVLTQHIVQLLSELGRCAEADAEADGLLSTEYHSLAANAVEECHDIDWQTIYDRLEDRQGEAGVARDLVQHVLDGRSRGVRAAVSSPPIEPAVNATAAEWAAAGECEILDDWLLSIPDVPSDAQDAAHRCSANRWIGQVAAARARFATSRLAWRTDGGDSNAEALEVIEAANALTTMLLVGLDETYTDVDSTAAELFEAATIAVAASSDAQHCEAGRTVVGTVERIERVHGATPDDRYSDALTQFQENCRTPRDRVRATGVGLTVAGGALLATGVAWDMVAMLGPEAERRRLQSECVGINACAADEDIFDLTERVSRSQLPVAILYAAGATAMATGAVVLVLKQRQSRRRTDALVWNVSPTWGGGSISLRF